MLLLLFERYKHARFITPRKESQSPSYPDPHNFNFIYLSSFRRPGQREGTLQGYRRRPRCCLRRAHPQGINWFQSILPQRSPNTKILSNHLNSNLSVIQLGLPMFCFCYEDQLVMCRINWITWKLNDSFGRSFWITSNNVNFKKILIY